MMTDERIKELANKWCLHPTDNAWDEVMGFAYDLLAEERGKVAQWMIDRSYATGHGDTIENLLAELDWQIAEKWTNALVKGVEGEREWVGLTNEEIDSCDEESGLPQWEITTGDLRAFAKVIEAKLKEKNA